MEETVIGDVATTGRCQELASETYVVSRLRFVLFSSTTMAPAEATVGASNMFLTSGDVFERCVGAVGRRPVGWIPVGTGVDHAAHIAALDAESARLINERAVA